MGFVGIRFELGQAVLCEYDAEGTLKAQPDGAGQSPQVASYDLMHPLGFAARAPSATAGSKGKPLGGGGCRLLIGRDGTDVIGELKGDPRDLALIPPLPVEGGAVMYAPGCAVPSFRVITSKDGTHQAYVEIDGSSHVYTFGRDANGEPVISWTHADGMAIEMFRESLRIKNKDGSVFAEFAPEKGTLSGNWKVVGTITNALGVSLFDHTHLTPLGPSGPPLPSL